MQEEVKNGKCVSLITNTDLCVKKLYATRNIHEEDPDQRLSKHQRSPNSRISDGTFSITARASDTGLAMFFTEDTAPLASVLPSMIMASSSTSPSAFSVAPCPSIKSQTHMFSVAYTLH